MFSVQDNKLIDMFNSLPTDYWDFKEEDTKKYTHGIHNYPAMMVCPISRNIINLVREVQPVKSIFDPFSGSGTVLVEGMLSGMNTIAGNDINPLALLLCKAKTTRINPLELFTVFSQLLEQIQIKFKKNSSVLKNVDTYISETLGLDILGKNGWGDNAPEYLKEYCRLNKVDIKIPNFNNLGYWFKPKVVLELSIIKSEIENINDIDIRDFAFVAMSETIRFVSNRRNGEFKLFRMTPDKLQKFNPDVYSEFSSILMRNLEKMAAFYSVTGKSQSDQEVDIFKNDTRVLQDVPNNAYDLVVTSPPYGDSRTTVAYGQYSRLSLQWLNLSNLDNKEIIDIDKNLMGGSKLKKGFDFSLKSETLKKSLSKIMDVDAERAGDVYSFYKDLDASIESIAKKVKRGSYQFWVVGNRTVKNELLKTDVIITELSQQYGLIPVYTVDRNIPNKVMPSRNSPTNEAGKTNTTMTTEHIVILRKE